MECIKYNWHQPKNRFAYDIWLQRLYVYTQYTVTPTTKYIFWIYAKKKRTKRNVNLYSLIYVSFSFSHSLDGFTFSDFVFAAPLSILWIENTINMCRVSTSIRKYSKHRVIREQTVMDIRLVMVLLKYCGHIKRTTLDGTMIWTKKIDERLAVRENDKMEGFTIAFYMRHPYPVCGETSQFYKETENKIKSSNI